MPRPPAPTTASVAPSSSGMDRPPPTAEAARTEPRMASRPLPGVGAEVSGMAGTADGGCRSLCMRCQRCHRGITQAALGPRAMLIELEPIPEPTPEPTPPQPVVEPEPEPIPEVVEAPKPKIVIAKPKPKPVVKPQPPKPEVKPRPATLPGYRWPTRAAPKALSAWCRCATPLV